MRKQLSLGSIRDVIEGIKQRINTDTDGALHYLGQELTNHSRHTGNFTDHTGNLRNSIGYAVASEGEVENVLDDRGHPLAQKKADEFAESIDSEKGRKKLVHYAGMEYGVFVEAKGYDVITQSVGVVPRKMREAFKK